MNVAAAQWFDDRMEFIIGVALAVLGIAVGIAVAWWQHKPKSLDYIITSKGMLMSEEAQGLKGKLTVTCGDEVINNPWIVTIRIINTGKVAVAKQDYDIGDPIRVEFSKTPPTDGHITASSPPDIFKLDETVGEIGPQGAVLTPKLLNAGDWFEVQLLSDGDPGDIAVDCRIADQRRAMRRLDASSERPAALDRLIVALPVCTWIAVLTYAWATQASLSSLGIALTVILPLLAMGLILNVDILRRRRN